MFLKINFSYIFVFNFICRGNYSLTKNNLIDAKIWWLKESKNLNSFKSWIPYVFA